ncbi:aldolase/citrate lyase family protein [Petroclostridium sp. X23]|nr:aldolase/citrate lyase family protein [Petroclostridium sp. X23]WHH61734.1 aldolase/citrate lyase family protein [Petroclostridium sp. X23]
MRRTMLFIPGNNPGMLLNGDVFGADSIILDLEDAVSPNEKDAARILVRNALRSLEYEGVEVIVRINSLSTPFWKRDLEVIIPEQPDVILPTKIQCREDIEIIDSYITNIEKEKGLPLNKVKLMPLLETALGIENAFEIAKASPRIDALYLGAEDLTADLKAKRTKEGKEIFYSRSRILVAAKAAGLPAVDTPFTDVDDEEGLIKDAVFAREMGFNGKAVISPRHIDHVNRIFTPSQQEIEYAQDVMEVIETAKKQGKGAISLNGKMIDAPIVERARQILEMAESLGRRQTK